MVILVDGFKKWEWLLKAAYKRLVEEFEMLGVHMNHEKTRMVDLSCDETFSFLGFNYWRFKTQRERGSKNHTSDEIKNRLAKRSQ